MNTIKEYSAYFTFKGLSDEQIAQVILLFHKQGLEVIINKNALEFDFAGRDLNNFVIQIFKEVAYIICCAEGELRCEIDDDEALDPSFSFFTIKDKKLWQQDGKIIRSGSITEVN